MTKITLFGSMLFYDRMLEIKSQLEKMSHETRLPPDKVKDKNGDLCR